MKRLLLIGPAPQNIGGISIHIRRLVGLIKNDYEIDYVDEGHIRYEGIFNLRSCNLIRYLIKVIKADIIHIHSGNWFLRAFHIFICKLLFRKRVIVTIHRDPSIEPHICMTKWLMNRCDYAILVNREGYETMRGEEHHNLVLQPAFLPPVMDEEPALPEEIIRWLAEIKKQKNSFVMCSNAWNLVMYDGEDLYGLDLCIEAMGKLKDDAVRQYSLIFVVASNTEQKDRMSYYKKQIEDNGLNQCVLIWEQPLSFVRLLRECDLVLRTTNTDGDAISVREALYFGKRVLASDIVERPTGVELFKTRNVDDLTIRIQEVANLGTVSESQQAVDFRSLYCKMYE